MSQYRDAVLTRQYVYEVAIVDFFNARHAIGEESPHLHSWKVEVRVRRPRYLGEQKLVAVEGTRQVLRRLFARYEDTLLNDLPPFTFQQPSTENLVGYFFEQLDKEFRGSEATLHSVTIWESPTNHVTLAVKE